MERIGFEGKLIYMRLIFVTLFIVFYNVANCQDTLYNVLTKNICNCLNYKKVRGFLTYNDAINCVNKENENQSELYIQEGILKYGESVTETQAIQFAKDFGLNVSLKLIDSCSSYRELMDTARYSLYNYLNKDSLIKEIAKLKLINTNDRNLNFYIKRARMLFWVSNFKDAFEDAEQILKIDSTNQLGLHILKWFN